MCYNQDRKKCIYFLLLERSATDELQIVIFLTLLACLARHRINKVIGLDCGLLITLISRFNGIFSARKGLSKTEVL